VTAGSVRVSLIEPFLGGSHRAWAQGWQSASRHSITIHGHAAAAWRWRMRGSAVTLAQALHDDVLAHGPPAALVATDMVDLAALLGLMRRSLAQVPAVLYFHENQLTYPRQIDEPLDQGLVWSMWRSMVVADEIWFNSEFHRDELLSALPDLLSSVPDHDHRHLLDGVIARSRVHPVGLDAAKFSRTVGSERTSEAPLILSSQRWHHDKDVGAVLRALIRAAEDGIDFRLAIVGDETGGQADELNPMIDQLGARVVARGQPPRNEYESLLQDADIVVSAARNEFFGIAVAEAIAAGAWPIVPDALAYREVIPSSFHAACLYERGRLGSALRSAIEVVASGQPAVAGLAATMARFDWLVVAEEHDTAIDEVVAGAPRPAH
jgi:glycosyltransferase involved in cell wall biosynthesis